MFSQFQDRNFQGFTKIHKTLKYFPQKFLAMQYVHVMCVSVSICLCLCVWCVFTCACVYLCMSLSFAYSLVFFKPMETGIQYYSEVMML